MEEEQKKKGETEEALYCVWCKRVIKSSQEQHVVVPTNEAHDEPVHYYHLACYQRFGMIQPTNKDFFDIANQVSVLEVSNEYILNPINTGTDRGMIEFIMKERKQYLSNFLEPVQFKQLVLPDIKKDDISNLHKRDLTRPIQAERVPTYDTINDFKNQYTNRVVDLKASKQRKEKQLQEAIDKKAEEASKSKWDLLPYFGLTSRRDKNTQVMIDAEPESKEAKPRSDYKFTVDELLTLHFLFGLSPVSDYSTEMLQSLLIAQVPVVQLFEKGITIRTFGQNYKGLTLYHFLVNGYHLKDLCLLGMNFYYMINLGFNHVLWRHYRHLIPVDIIVNLFQVKMPDMYFHVFYNDVSKIIACRFTPEELAQMDCDFSFLVKQKLNAKHIKEFGFTRDEWISVLGASQQEFMSIT